MRPEILFPLFQDVTALPGIGPRLAALVAKVAGPRVKDVLFLGPTGLVDRTRQVHVTEAVDGEIVTLTATVEDHIPGRRQGQPYKVRMRDESGFLHLVYFHPRPDYLQRLLPVGETRIVSGRCERFGSEIQMLHPDLVMTEEEAAQTPLIEPVYPLTAGLAAKTLRKAVGGAVALLPDLPEWLDPAMAAERHWPSFRDAVRALHAPQSAADLDPDHPARARLAFDEVFARQMALQLVRARRKAQSGRPLAGTGEKVRAILDNAPFAPTGAQTRAFEAIRADMESGSRMTRLLHGDVGRARPSSPPSPPPRPPRRGRRARSWPRRKSSHASMRRRWPSFSNRRACRSLS